MKYILYTLILFTCPQTKTDKEKIIAFSENLVNIISEEKICELSQARIFPTENTITLRAIDYILGNDHQKGFVELFKNEKIVTKVYGPYEVDKEKYFYLIYYDPNKIKLDNKGNLDSKTIKENWGKYYVETLVTIVDSEVHFYRTPFFFETDILW